jgi:hypothetical protein
MVDIFVPLILYHEVKVTHNTVAIFMLFTHHEVCDRGRAGLHTPLSLDLMRCVQRGSSRYFSSLSHYYYVTIRGAIINE